MVFTLIYCKKYANLFQSHLHLSPLSWQFAVAIFFFIHIGNDIHILDPDYKAVIGSLIFPSRETAQHYIYLNGWNHNI